MDRSGVLGPEAHLLFNTQFPHVRQ